MNAVILNETLTDAMAAPETEKNTAPALEPARPPRRIAPRRQRRALPAAPTPPAIAHSSSLPHPSITDVQDTGAGQTVPSDRASSVFRRSRPGAWYSTIDTCQAGSPAGATEDDQMSRELPTDERFVQMMDSPLS